MRLTFITVTLILLSNLQAFGQATVFSENAETGATGWITTNNTVPNYWNIFTCAGNGTSDVGSTSFYITYGGIPNGCTPGDKDYYGYQDSPSGQQVATIYSPVDATCASGLTLEYDYRIDGLVGEDFGQVAYSTNMGATWIQIGADLVNSSSWNSQSIVLPAILDNASFLIAFRYFYSDATINGDPLAFDNVTITGTDIVPPLITCNATILVPTDASCMAIAGNYGNQVVTLSDNCTDSSMIVISQSISPGTNLAVAPGADVPMMIIATDESGNSTSCNTILQVRDTTAPIISCGTANTIFMNASCQGPVPNLLPQSLATDNCTSGPAIVYVQNPVTGTIVSGAGNTTVVTVSATDGAGNTSLCTYNLVHQDTLKASIICPGDQNVYANSSCTANLGDYTALATPSDNCAMSSALTVTQNPAPGTVINTITLVALTVTGGSPSGSTTCDFTVLIIDTIKPNILCPLPTLIYANNTCMAALPDYTGSTGGSDNCGGTITITQNPPAGTLVNNNQLVTMTGTDASGNSNTCSFSQPVSDTVSPVINCSNNFTIYADATCNYSIPNITSIVSYSDNCSSVANITVSQSPLAGTNVSSNGFITLTVTDESMNTSTCNYPYTISDTTNPVLICTTPVSEYLNSSCFATISDYSSVQTTTDNCTVNGFFTYTQNPPAGTMLSGVSSQNIMLNATDESGNTTSCNFSISLIDTISPGITCPASVNQIGDAQCESSAINYSSVATLTDNCTSSIFITQSPIFGTTLVNNDVIVLTATDSVGNNNTCSFTVQIIDTMKPTFLCPQNQQIIVSSNCDYVIPDFTGNLNGTDNCTASGNLVYSQNPIVGTTASGITTVSITATDEQANSYTCSFQLSPNDTTTPTITCPGNQTLNIGVACNTNIIDYTPQATALDNCMGLNIFQNPAVGTNIPIGPQTVTITTTDQGGNSASCSFTLSIIDNQIPVITCPSNISSCNPVVNFADATATDNCLYNVSRTDMFSFQTGDTFPIGTTTLSYIAIDSSGNSSTCSFDITVFQNPSQANITSPNTQLCETFSTILSADTPSFGTTEWTLLSGTGNIVNQFATTTQVNGLSYGLNQFLYTVTSPNCGSTSDTVNVNVYQTPSQANISQDSVYICSSNTAFILASAPLIGTGLWNSLEGNPIQAATSNTTTSTILLGGWKTYIWSVSNGSCPVSRDTLRVFKSIIPVFNIPDTTICDKDLPIQLSVNNINVPSVNKWNINQGNLTFDTYFGTTVNTNNNGIGTNVIEYESQQYNCIAVTNTVVIMIEPCGGYNPDIPNVMTPNGDGKNDLFEIPNLNSLYPDCNVFIFNRWGSVVYESVGYLNPWDGTFKSEKLPVGTYFYKVELNNSDNEILKGSINLIR